MWSVVHTEPGHEGMACAGLIGRRFRTYLPMVEEARNGGHGRARRDPQPMFRQYLFAVHDPLRWRAMCSVAGVRHLLARHGGRAGEDGPALLPDAVVRAIFVLESRMADRTQETRACAGFQPGEIVRIIGGIFDGFTAEFERLDSDGRIAVLLYLFGRLSRVNLPVEQVAKIRNGDLL